MTFPHQIPDLWAKEAIVDKLVRKFSLSTYQEAPDTVFIPRTVQLISDADRLVRDLKIVQNDVAVAATGAVILRTVPAGKLNTIVFARAAKLTGTYTFDLWGITPDGGTTLQTIKTFSAATANTYGSTDKTFELPEEYALYINCNSFTTGGNVRLSLLYYEENAFRL